MDITVIPAEEGRPKVIRLGLEPFKRDPSVKDRRWRRVEGLAKYHRLHPLPYEENAMKMLDGLGVAYKFQEVLPNLRICDFLIESARLVIEIDGAAHRRPSWARRQARWEKAVRKITGGYRIVHISNAQALRADLDEWLAALIGGRAQA